MSVVLARRILADCEKAIEWLEVEDSSVKRRIYWIALTAMLRTIGDVLQKSADPNIRSRYQAASRRWKEQAEHSENIFYHFIRDERNNVAHEYEFGHIDDCPMEYIYEDASGQMASENISDVYWPMATGPYEGLDARDMIVEAINWWHQELEVIEKP